MNSEFINKLNNSILNFYSSLNFSSIYIEIFYCFLIIWIIRKRFYKYFIFSFFPTLFHEFSHLIGNLIFFNKIKDFSFFPKNNKVLGNVVAVPRFNGSMVISSIAPFVFIPLFSFFLIYQIIVSNNFSEIEKLFYIWIIFIFILPGFKLSNQDLKVFKDNLFSFNGIIIFLLLLFIYMIFIFNFTFIIQYIFFSNIFILSITYLFIFLIFIYFIT